MKHTPLAKGLLGLTLASCIAVPLVAAGTAQASQVGRTPLAASSSSALAGSQSSSRAVPVSGQRVLPEASRLQLVETRAEGDLVHTTLRGTAGAQYVLAAWNAFGKTIAHSQGTVPQDGLLRLDVPVGRDDAATLHAHTSGSNGAFADDFRISNPGTTGPTQPIVAEPAPGTVDAGFTVTPTTPEPTDPVVAEPAPGAVDPGFTVTPTTPEPTDPVIAEPAPGAVDPGFTVTPGDGDQAHHPDLRYQVTKSGLQFGGYAQIRVEDRALVGSDRSYDVEVFVDGVYNSPGHISGRGAGSAGPGVGLLGPMNMGGAGDHQVEVKYQGETVLTLTVTL